MRKNRQNRAAKWSVLANNFAQAFNLRFPAAIEDLPFRRSPDYEGMQAHMTRISRT
jgi:hypothetical protein